MRRRTLVRDLIGTLLMFVVLVVLVFVLLLGEHYLDNFKSH
jgi:hypothetical protein